MLILSVDSCYACSII